VKREEGEGGRREEEGGEGRKREKKEMKGGRVKG
jgi:hypothetical protein